MPHNEALTEATALYRLLLGIEKAISRSQAGGKFPGCANDFLANCRQAILETKKDVVRRLDDTRGNPQALQDCRGAIAQLRGAWVGLHDFIKPVLDATALQIPYPLTNLLNHQVQSIPEMEDVRILVCLTPQLNYFQRRHTGIRRLLADLKTVVRKCPEFGKIGFVSLPFFESRGLFLNCILYHEIGHLIFEEKEYRSQLWIDFLTSIQQDKRFSNPMPVTRSWLLQRLMAWAEELFADLMAITLLGPGYTFAGAFLIHLLVGLLPDEGQQFHDLHPPHALRFREQLRALRRRGWTIRGPLWQQVRKEGAAKNRDFLPPSEYEQGFQDNVWRPLMDIFLQAVPGIHALCADCIQPTRTAANDFAKYDAFIQESIAHGVVPSLVTTNAGSARPTTTSIINSAMMYWLDGMDDLYKIFNEANQQDVEDRSVVEGRVEGWAMKAVEDWLLAEGKVGS
ncbi:MAG TPA: hypothetical protein ENH80_09650 [Phycisphaerae bacterium]|nr:hypothetical protein [Phycisphaerae bacterium]HDZ44190.1 hypothetical protein [Phycisphaerae bacterium]